MEELKGWVEPLAALRSVASRRRPVLLLSALAHSHGARWSILAWDPVAEVTLRGRVGMLARRPGCGDPLRFEGDPFELLRALAPAQAGARAPDLPFSGGAIGYLGYGMRHAVERVTAGRADPLDLPDAWFGFYECAVLFDHASSRVVTVTASQSESSGRRSAAERRLEAHRCLATAREGAPSLIQEDLSTVEAIPVTSRDDYLRAVRRVLDLIARGDLYQVNLSHRISCLLRETPLDLFARLATRNPAPFAAYLDAGPYQVACASPERFVALRGERATSSPIKGTRPRGRDGREDASLARALTQSAKDRAENVMITDLVRNDLGRVCAAGSVLVESLCGLESFATVHHLVSTVTGRLARGRDRFDLLRALFPGGSMTGAPKVRAMEVITALEGEERGIYSGGIGYLSLDGGMDFNIVIRTAVCGGGQAHLRVGGGIVADSEPAAEYRETLDKAKALLAALGGVVSQG